MAPPRHLINSLKRSETIARSVDPPGSSLDIGATVGIAIGIAFVCSFALACAVYFFYARRKRSMALRARRENWTGATENGVYGTKACAPKAGLGLVLSILSPARRKSRCEQQTRSSQHLPDKVFEDLREPAVELDGGLRGGNTALVQTEVNRSQGAFADAHRQVGINAPVPSYTSATKPERDVESTGYYGLEGTSAPDMLVTTMPSTTDATAPAAWHRKRTGPPPPLTIEPPGMHSQSPSDPYSAYSTYATARSPYEYCAINVPSVPPLPSHITTDGFANCFPYDAADSIHSSTSNHSSHPLHYPPSPQTPGSIPSMSRSDSGAQETQPLAPPTPTYSLPRSQPSPQRATVIEATHFECLGPLPDHIPIPSPPHFRTHHQQQQDPFLTPRAHSPEDRSQVAQENNTTVTSATGETIQVFVQDPLLHESNPFRPYHSPVNSTFTREHSIHAGSLQDGDLNKTRRESTDSLGSNFTVEEEARIQEQIVKNLDALDKERVMGEMDIVHIPQVSEKRYSWED